MMLLPVNCRNQFYKDALWNGFDFWGVCEGMSKQYLKKNGYGSCWAVESFSAD